MSASKDSRGAPAHHIEEFGEVENVVHVDGQDIASAKGASSIFSKKHVRKVRKRLVRKRHLQQYFKGETLYRTSALRGVRQDELFLDLIIVANIAAIGHDFREAFAGWLEFEKFLLLFLAVYSSWRSMVMFWNFWDVTGDLFDKVIVYVTFALLTVIGIGTHGAFKDGIRPYVAVAAFGATAIPQIFNALFSKKERLLAHEHNLFNQQLFNAALQLIATAPYLAAAFVSSETAARVLFWIPPFAQIIVMYAASQIYRKLHQKPERQGYTRPAVNIELLVEKYEVLTLIVLGESLLAILFEAAKYILEKEARILLLFLAVLGSAGLVYSLQTLYINVDNKIVPGGVHAIRHRAVLGMLWSVLHIPYHVCVVLLATGLGILIRDVIIDPSKKTVNAETVNAAARILAVVRAAKEETSGPYFGVPQRWLFSVGWGGALVFSAVLAKMHKRSPREFAKYPRLIVRCVVAVALGIGMPFSGASAGAYLLVHTLVTAAMALAEFVLVQVDTVNIFGRLRAKRRNEKPDFNVLPDDSFDDSDDDLSDNEFDSDAKRNPNEPEAAASPDPEAQKARMCKATRALNARMNLRSRHRMQVVESGKKQCTTFES